jgi:cytochrome P450
MPERIFCRFPADRFTMPKPPPGPRNPFNLAFISFRRNPLGFLDRMTRKYGDYVAFKVMGRRLFFVNHPDYIRDVLVTQNSNFAKGRALEKARRLLGFGLLTSEGETHHRNRRLVLPAFHRQRIASYGAVMVEHAKRMSDRWQDGETFDMCHEMTRLTLGIVSKTLFDADVENEADEISEAMTTILKMFHVLMYPFADLLEKLPLPKVRRYKKMQARLDSTIYKFIDERRKSGEDRGDLLSMLLLSQDEEGGGLTDIQVRDEAMTLFIAGHETTANALSWTWYLLSQHPDVETKVHAEWDEVIGDETPTIEHVPKLQYTEMVIMESMRLFPPAWAIGRRSIVDQTLGPYFVPKDTIVLVSPFITHRDARFFPEPSKFIPDRWTSEFRESLPQFSYFPFGGGTRRCIGESFAWTETILIMAVLGSQWHARLIPSQKVEPLALITLRPKHGIQMRVEKRRSTT